MFLENASTHGVVQNLPPLRYIRIEFLPKRTTSILQPLDGSHRILKKRNARKIARREIDSIDSGHTKQLYKVNMKEAAIWVNEIWNQIQSQII